MSAAHIGGPCGRCEGRADEGNTRMTDTLPPAEAYALRRLTEEARTFAAKFRPRKEGANIPASYARALAQLVSAARAFAQRSDESWAAEVAELRDRLATTEAP